MSPNGKDPSAETISIHPTLLNLFWSRQNNCFTSREVFLRYFPGYWPHAVEFKEAFWKIHIGWIQYFICKMCHPAMEIGAKNN